jgi:plasmid stability protein
MGLETGPSEQAFALVPFLISPPILMAELHLTDLDDEVLARLHQRAERQDRSVEDLVQEELERALSISPSEKPTEQEAFDQAVKRLRATSPEERMPDVEPVESRAFPRPSCSSETAAGDNARLSRCQRVGEAVRD